MNEEIRDLCRAVSDAAQFLDELGNGVLYNNVYREELTPERLSQLRTLRYAIDAVLEALTPAPE